MATELNPIHDSGSQAGDGRSRVLALLEVGQSILSERNVSETLELIAQKALETSGAESAGVMLVDRSDGLVRYRAVAGRGDTAPLQSGAQHPGEGLAGRAVAKCAPCWSADISTDVRLKYLPLMLDPVEFDLPASVEQVAELLSENAHVKGLELTCQVDSAVPRRVVGDPIQHRQILVNLVGNAVKFTEHGEVAVSVTMDAESPSVVHRQSSDSTCGTLASESPPVIRAVCSIRSFKPTPPPPAATEVVGWGS